MSSRPPLGGVDGKAGDGEEISATVTKPYLMKSNGRKNLSLPYDLLDVMGLPLPLQ